MLSIPPPPEETDCEVDGDDGTEGDEADGEVHELRLPPLGTATVSPTVIMFGLLMPELAASSAASETPCAAAIPESVSPA